jgi:phosphocarrier protein HPr
MRTTTAWARLDRSPFGSSVPSDRCVLKNNSPHSAIREPREPGGCRKSVNVDFATPENCVTDSCSAKLKIVNHYGLHARPAMDFATAAGNYNSEVRVRANDEDADGKSVMDLMLLAATKGTQIEVVCNGSDAKDCLEHLSDMIRRGFDEDDA